MIRVAVIGAGAVANEQHLPAWRKVPGTAVTAVCDTNAQSAEGTARRWGIANHYTGIAEMLKSEKPTLIDICTPPAAHACIVGQALSAGCSVIIEKPLAATPDESREIRDIYLAHKDTNVKLGVIYNWMFQPQFRAMQNKISSGFIGDILNVEIRCLHPKTEAMVSNPGHWCHSMPGGRLGEVVVHPVYLMYKLIGNFQISELQLAKRGPYPWVRFDELSALVTARNSFGNIYISFNSPKSEFPVITVYGTKGQMTFNGFDMSLLTVTPKNSRTIFNRGINSLAYIGKYTGSLAVNTVKTITGAHRSNHEVFFRLFLDYIRGRGRPPLPLEEAFEINEIYLDLLGRIP